MPSATATTTAVSNGTTPKIYTRQKNADGAPLYPGFMRELK